MKKTNSLLLTGIVLSAITVITTFSACNDAQTKGKTQADYAHKGAATATTMDETVRADSTQARAADTDAGLSPQVGKAPKDVMLIKEGDMDVSVTDMKESAKKLEKWIDHEGGYYLEWEQFKQDPQDNLLNVSITVKVPSDHFESFKDSLQTIGSILDEKIGATDITDDYQTVQSGMTSGQYTKERYTQIASKTKNTKEALAVQEKLDEQQSSMDASQNGIDQMHRHMAMGTFHIRLSQLHPWPADPNNDFGRRFLANLRSGAETLETIVLFFISIWPVVLVMIGGIFLWINYGIKLKPKHDSTKHHTA